jgi:hypothetical protein
MLNSQNGWPVYTQPSDRPDGIGLRHFNIPGVPGETVVLRDGSAGFVLVHFATWYNKYIQPIGGQPLDDWGWNYNPIPGNNGMYSGSALSNHASGTALDLNATKHPYGAQNTFTPAQVLAIHKRLNMYKGAIRWGNDYQHSTIDSMHFEINQPKTLVNALAINLENTPLGREILKANPGQAGVQWGLKHVIES